MVDMYGKSALECLEKKRVWIKAQWSDFLTCSRVACIKVVVLVVGTLLIARHGSQEAPRGPPRAHQIQMCMKNTWADAWADFSYGWGEDPPGSQEWTQVRIDTTTYT